jgi:hypothetical protein
MRGMDTQTKQSIPNYAKVSPQNKWATTVCLHTPK